MIDLISVGLSLVVIGIIIVIVGIILSAIKLKQIKTEGGFIFWIGPIPITGFATRKEFLYFLIGISIIMFILLILLRRFL